MMKESYDTDCFFLDGCRNQQSQHDIEPCRIIKVIFNTCEHLPVDTLSKYESKHPSHCRIKIVLELLKDKNEHLLHQSVFTIDLSSLFDFPTI